MFKKIFQFLTSRWVLSVIGMLFLCLFIWYIGQLLAFGNWMPLGDETTRIIFIALVIAIWIGWNLYKSLKQKKTNQAIINTLTGNAQDNLQQEASQGEVEQLQQRFKQALQTLKKSRLGGSGGFKYLYQLPWYVIIGPPGAGKTTALKNSGLNFPLQEGFGSDPVKGVGGTRNCDWWFTNEAVLLDTAGRYTTQDSDESVDKQAWGGFLQLLKKHRGRKPLNGVLLAFSLTDIIGQSEQGLQMHARAVRKRLQEINETLKVQVPVYLIFTKADLLDGFMEFFDDMDQRQREQIWGMTFELSQSESAEQLTQQFEQQFSQLVSQLDKKLLPRIQAEFDYNKRARIQGFPEQFAGLKPAISRFLNEVFAPSQYEQKNLLRGVYFSSGTQEGTPIDRLIGSVSRAFGLQAQAKPAFSGPGRSYFLTRLLKQVIFTEAELGISTGFWAKHRAWVERIGYSLAGIFFILMIIGWYSSYQNNLDYIADVEQQVASYENVSQNLVDSRGEITEILPYLNMLRNIQGGYADQDKSIPFLMGMGLYQGDKIGPVAIDAYKRALNNVLMPRVIERLEKQLVDNNQISKGQFLYAALKVYLMLGHPGRYDADEVSIWVTTDWANQLPGASNKVIREQIVGHLQALLETDDIKPMPLQGRLVENVRLTLARQSLAERVYGQIKRSPMARKLGEWRIIDNIGADAARYFRFKSGAPLSKGLPGLFTLQGYHDVLLKNGESAAEQAAKETWVLRESEREALNDKQIEELYQDVTKLYFADYVREWDHYLNDLDIAQFDSFADGAQKVKDLSADTSPIKSLLVHIGEQTVLASSSADFIDVVDESDRISRIKQQVNALLEKAGDVANISQNKDPAAVVDRHFARLHEIIKQRDQTPAPITATLSNLNELFLALSAVDATINSGGLGLTTADANSSLQGVMRRIQLEANRQPEPLRHWLYSLVRESNMVLVRNSRERFNQVWQSSVLSFCHQAIGSRYPINPSSANDINLSDFSRFFGPAGLLDDFFKTYLSSFIDTSTNPWSLVNNAGATLEINPQIIAYFERAQRIRQTYFMGNATSPSLSFQVMPIQLDAKASQSLIELGDQRITYQHGPARLTRIVWPPTGGFERARLSVRNLSSQAATNISTDGPWAWFRLMDKGEKHSSSNRDRFRVTFELGGLKAGYEVRADSVYNPFISQDLRLMGCPESL
ncbi:type VI secretion system membrane subunit TssM [Neptunicella marina]|uniref:Type VI secretion system membrane subunit TssM n=1 Tax=Neptunicella marina TaxID=2125989 RepID=A0A8J6M011_9ALTE|nr:type VI secretion system membrane subunit TssM [Neptunicella marina]